MACKDICGAKSLLAYIEEKLARYEKEEKNMQTLFRYMFSESENVMAETSDGYRIKSVSYGECRESILRFVPVLKSQLSFVKEGSMVGLYMDNSLAWIQTFWTILALGYKPMLLNLKVSEETIEDVICQYGIEAVVSDGKEFSVRSINALSLLDTIGEEKAELEDLTFENEVVFMSSGTTDKVKLCSYRGKNFFYQIKDSANIVKTCPEIARDYEGRIKQLALLPLYHVFGFIAMYLWFGFFSRTFVFLKDLRPKTITSTVKKHKVTHIFAVPLVWELVYKEVLRNVKSRGKKAQKRFEKGMKLASTDIGKKLVYKAFSEIRSATFGDSIKFMISGGSHVKGEVIKFFNAIGYHLCNGYGMTEIGITSVELSNKIKILSSETVGKPLSSVEYKINENGQLCVKGKSMARKICVGGVETVNDYDAWFNTQDLAREENGRYYILGRSDDLIVCENGENLNPVIVENLVKTNKEYDVCLIKSNGNPVLIASYPNCVSVEKAENVKGEIRAKLTENKLDGQVRKIEITTSPLMDSSDFKISRKKVAQKYHNGALKIIDSNTKMGEVLSEAEERVAKLFALALKTDDKIGLDADFFTDLGGTSLDYFELVDSVKTEYGVDLPVEGGMSLTTVRQTCEFLLNNL